MRNSSSDGSASVRADFHDRTRVLAFAGAGLREVSNTLRASSSVGRRGPCARVGRGPTREDRPRGGRRAAQRPELPPIDEPEKKKNQTSKATAAMITTTMTMRSAPVIRAELP